MSSNERQCNPEGNVSFPLRFDSSNITNIPQQTPNITMSFNSRRTNPKFEDESRTSGGFLNEISNSFTIQYLNSSYTLVSSQICLSTHSILLGDDKTKNIIDIIFTLETEDLSPRFIIVIIPLLKYENTSVSIDNTYLGSILNQDVSGNYSIKDLFTGLNKFLWYQTCLEPHGDNALAYVNLQGIKVSENLYLNLLGVWKKESPYDIQNSLKVAVSNIKNSITNFCKTTSSEDSVGDLNNSINSLQASVYVPKRNPSVESWPRYMAPYDIVLSVQTNPITTSSMRTEGFQAQGVTGVTGVYVTTSGGAKQEINLNSIQTQGSNPVSESDIKNDLARISQNSVDGKDIDLGEFKCVSLDMDGAIDNNRIHFDSMGIPLTDIYTKRNALRTEAQVNKVSTDKLETYFAYGLAAIIGFVLLGFAIRFIYTQWINKSTAAASIIPDNTNKLGFYLIMGFIMAFAGFLIGAAITSI
jgi:hypothetical protein